MASLTIHGLRVKPCSLVYNAGYKIWITCIVGIAHDNLAVPIKEQHEEQQECWTGPRGHKHLLACEVQIEPLVVVFCNDLSKLWQAKTMRVPSPPLCKGTGGCTAYMPGSGKIWLTDFKVPQVL